MLIGVPKETAPGERRVALVPETVARLAKAGSSVLVERGAGTRAAFTDEAYEAAGATLARDAAEVFAKAEFIAKVGRPSDGELAQMRAGQTLLAFLSPLGDPQSVERYAAQRITALSMDAIPRTTRAQSMDALSSQANIAGYKAVLIAALELPRFFPMLTTAAGTIRPAKTFVLGAGVAGLQAIATARRLGSVVSGFDTRSVVKEQVQSLGASFVEFDLGVDAAGAGGYAKALTAEQETKQQSLLAEYIHGVDVVITTAAVPGRRAPLLINEDAVRGMKPGSVIVDLAAETGGNCALTESGQVVQRHGVTIVGTINLPSLMPSDASTLYSRNVFTLLQLIAKDGTLNLDMSDEIIAGTTLVKDGAIVHEATKAALTGSNA
ncbi:MAG: Re/Si-specific NAD(P)(+) transhydrogenase subunit alpha [Candidatus Eremiobacteraeota bacterium]|nr:Re/Si-specific NAD(P)(+) transhydrogenase subunit alpha [Candidatus Eremiobacteraeota bacterium]